MIIIVSHRIKDGGLSPMSLRTFFETKIYLIVAIV